MTPITEIYNEPVKLKAPPGIDLFMPFSSDYSLTHHQLSYYPHKPVVQPHFLKPKLKFNLTHAITTTQMNYFLIQPFK